MMNSLISWMPEAGYRPVTLRSVDDLFRTFFDPLQTVLRPEMMTDSGCALRMEVEAREKEVCATLPMAGCKPEDFSVEIQGGTLTVRVRRTVEDCGKNKGRYLRRERTTEEYEESVQLPCPVKAGEASAQYRDGVLNVTVPREADPKKLTCQVKVG